MGGRRFAPASSHRPETFLLFSSAVAGAIPSLSTSRSGARPRCLNHREAAFSNEKALRYFGTSKRTILAKCRDLW
jgi:hypothetical protein